MTEYYQPSSELVRKGQEVARNHRRRIVYEDRAERYHGAVERGLIVPVPLEDAGEYDLKLGRIPWSLKRQAD